MTKQVENERVDRIKLQTNSRRAYRFVHTFITNCSWSQYYTRDKAQLDMFFILGVFLYTCKCITIAPYEITWDGITLR